MCVYIFGNTLQIHEAILRLPSTPGVQCSDEMMSTKSLNLRMLTINPQQWYLRLRILYHRSREVRRSKYLRPLRGHSSSVAVGSEYVNGLFGVKRMINSERMQPDKGLSYERIRRYASGFKEMMMAWEEGKRRRSIRSMKGNLIL